MFSSLFWFLGPQTSTLFSTVTCSYIVLAQHYMADNIRSHLVNKCYEHKCSAHRIVIIILFMLYHRCF